MVLVSHKYKFIYIKNVKVAGSSVETFFGRYCINPKKKYNYNDTQKEHIDKFGILGSRTSGMKDKDIWWNHKNAVDIKRDLGEQKFNEYFKFCVVRNPYEKVVSGYNFFNKGTSSFKEYVTNLNGLKDSIQCNIDGKNVCDFFIRFEHLNEDIKELCKKLKIDSYDLSLLPYHKKLPDHKKSKGGKHWSSYYDNETKEIVYKKFKCEFELHGYSRSF